MKKHITIVFLLFLFLSAHSQTGMDTIYENMYKALRNKDVYGDVKEQRILGIRKMLNVPDLDQKQRYNIYDQLHEEYKAYISDSAIHYLKLNLQIAKELNNTEYIYKSKIGLSFLYSVSGKYFDSLKMLEEIDKGEIRKMPEWMLVQYFGSYKQLYQYYSGLEDSSTDNDYYIKSNMYRDSILTILNPNDEFHSLLYAEKLSDDNKAEEAYQLVSKLLDNHQQGDRERAIYAYVLARICQKQNKIDEAKKYYAISATYDITNAVKEHASMQALASLLYEQGDIENAYLCMKSSMDDAMFCKARFRTFEASRIFPIINSAYQDKVAKQKEELRFFLTMISLLSVFLIIAVGYVYYQMKRVTRIRKELHETNTKLSGLNDDLQGANGQLHQINRELSEVNSELFEANQIKEAYIGHFLDLCSTYINKLEKYQNTLNKKAAEKKLDELYKMLKSHEMIDNELKELYENFDNIFLHLYPNFVDDFNSLLLEEERFILKPKELLNVELRIFALIRLGISDSSKIASFLHYSSNTIYSYRTRVRNKAAVPRNEFEKMVLKIGSIKR